MHPEQHLLEIDGLLVSFDMAGKDEQGIVLFHKHGLLRKRPDSFCHPCTEYNSCLRHCAGE